MIKRLLGHTFALAAVAVLVLTILHRDRYTSLCPLGSRTATVVAEPTDGLPLSVEASQSAAETTLPDSAVLLPTENGDVPLGEAAPEAPVTPAQDDTVHTGAAAKR